MVDIVRPFFSFLSLSSFSLLVFVAETCVCVLFLWVGVKVVNHVAATASSTFETSSAYGSFDEQSDFHSFCWINDYTNQTDVEQCWLGDENVALPDVRFPFLPSSPFSPTCRRI